MAAEMNYHWNPDTCFNLTLPKRNADQSTHSSRANNDAPGNILRSVSARSNPPGKGKVEVAQAEDTPGRPEMLEGLWIPLLSARERRLSRQSTPKTCQSHGKPVPLLYISFPTHDDQSRFWKIIPNRFCQSILILYPSYVKILACNSFPSIFSAAKRDESDWRSVGFCRTVQPNEWSFTRRLSMLTMKRRDSICGDRICTLPSSWVS